MSLWLARRDAPVETGPLKRFDPSHWTVDFPRGCIASLTSAANAHAMTVDAEFLRESDLVGLIWSSEDQASHPAHARRTDRDYSGTRLSFRWRSQGLMPLDQPNGATLTIEGRDAGGTPRSWWVRLWNYAQGTGEDAEISLDFDALDAGYSLPADADRVYPRDIDRMFISLVPSDYAGSSNTVRAAAARAEVTIDQIACSGPGSVIEVGTSWQPTNPYAACTAYDDQYHLPPGRLIEAIERLGYRKTINHYVGMSHYMALGGDGKIEPSRPMNDAALAWHRELAAEAASRGFDVIWSLSYEILDEFCPSDWKQRDASGEPALTGWVPPSTLVSPANGDAIGYLTALAETLVGIAQDAGLAPKIQIGEPWWWINAAGQPCLYDAAAVAAFGGAPPQIVTLMTATLGQDERNLLDDAGALLAQSTAQIAAGAKAIAPSCETHLLVFLPSLLAADAPEAKRANLPLDWASPAFDRLQVEDYDWVTSGVATATREAAMDEVVSRLGYPRAEQHYLAGFATSSQAAATQWPMIVKAAEVSLKQGFEVSFIWAMPQVLRDGVVLMNKENDMDAIVDEAFPIAIGSDASVAPTYSTQVVTSASGHEYRNANWSSARLHFDAGPGIRSEAEMERLLDFFRSRRGSAQAFRFRDPFDHSSNGMTGAPEPTDQHIGEGDGATVRYALTKAYGDSELRAITRPEAGSVRVAVDGIEAIGGWALEAGGVVIFESAPSPGAVVTAGFLFDVPVRFANDRLDINRATFLAGDVPSVPMIEVREEAGA